MFIICSSLLIKYSTFTVFVSSVKALIVLVSSSTINISYAGFRTIIDIIIVNNNVSGRKIYPWGTPLFIGKVSHCPYSSLTDCLQLVEYYCCEFHSNGSWYLTDRFALNNRVHVCHTCRSVSHERQR